MKLFFKAFAMMVVLLGCLLVINVKAAIINADFENFTVGYPPPTGMLSDRPRIIDSNLIVTVENSTTISGPSLSTGNFLRLKESFGEAPDLAFDSGVSFLQGNYRISMDLLFENTEYYHVHFRNGVGSGLAPGSQVIADIIFDDHGMIELRSLGGKKVAWYPIGETINIRSIFNLDSDTWSVWINDKQVVDEMKILDGYLGSVVVGFEFSSWKPGCCLDGIMQLDNVRFEAVPIPSSFILLGSALFGIMIQKPGKASNRSS